MGVGHTSQYVYDELLVLARCSVWNLLYSKALP